MSDRRLPITRPFLPPLAEYVSKLEGIWKRGWLTNNGALVRELEESLQAALGLERPVRCVSSGTVGLQLALRSLGVRGEVVTTPFSFIATASSALWQGHRVRFADIEPTSLTLDAGAVEAAITSDTEAIVATHVYGNPCDVDGLDAVARKHGLALIYDAAHAFGVTYRGRSVLEYGDASVVSLHATKLMHAVEGGFIATRDAEHTAGVSRLRNFGYADHAEFEGIGINGKMSELHAAMGLCVLDHTAVIARARQRVCAAYDEALSGSSRFQFAFQLRQGATWNHCYYPVLCKDRADLDLLGERLSRSGASSRRYFSPSLDVQFAAEATSAPCPVSRDIAARVLCLPLSASMTEGDIAAVSDCLAAVSGLVG